MNFFSNTSWLIFLLIPVGLVLPEVCLTQITIDTAGFITVKSNTTFFIDGTMTIKSGTNSSGHFADQTDGTFITINDNVTVERYLTPNLWHNCASPVNNIQSTVYAGTDLVFYYDETIIENDWEFGWVMHDGPLNVMKGYDVYLESPVTVNYTGTSSAELNTGTYSINVTRTNPPNGEIESRKGWNLVGNPYPSPVDWLSENGWDKTFINDAKYIWDPVNQNYSVFLGGEDPIDLNNGTRYIPANQGFWVQAIHDGTFEINNFCRVGEMQDTPGFYKKNGFDYPVLFLCVEADGLSDETAVRFLESATMGFDIGLDACSIFGREGYSPQISTKYGNEKLDINTMPEITENMQISLAFNYGGHSVCTLKMKKNSTLCASAGVYIKDLKKDILIDLSENSEYRFMADYGDESRFKLFINPSEDIKNNISAQNAYAIYAYKNLIYVIKNTSIDQTGHLILFDMYGNIADQVLLPNSKQFCHVPGISRGYYIVRVKTDDFLISKKIWIN